MKEIQQEITPITNEDLFIILNHPNAHFDYPIHCHPEYEINLVMNTRGSRIVGDSTEDFGPLDLVMTGPYVPHVWKSPLKTNHVITIQFSGDLIDFPIVNKRLFLPIRQLLLDSRQGLSFTGPEQLSVRDRILELTRMQGFQSATAFLDILNALATANRKVLMSNLCDSKNIVHTSKSRRIAKVCDYIEKNLCQPGHVGEPEHPAHRRGRVGQHVGIGLFALFQEAHEYLLHHLRQQHAHLQGLPAACQHDAQRLGDLLRLRLQQQVEFHPHLH